uniref:Uncharacterized protein n=1 Tax=Myoviridae sp. ctxym25 TaxID=2825210 RepID=A0A8S5QH44_9CAUD|nr:MAG TPA: hypothetical protein [Myoviridae sp. ctxym25]DAH07219.1 MAG TPA: hypothetical protein [Caudoviricetes sp.]
MGYNIINPVYFRKRTGITTKLLCDLNGQFECKYKKSIFNILLRVI